MAIPSHHPPFPSRLWDALSGAIGGIIGSLLVNITFPETPFPYVVYVFVLPGLILGAVFGFFLSPRIGRVGAAITTTLVGYFALLVGILLLMK
jgi:hypothetical protein